MERNKIVNFLKAEGEIVYLEKNNQGNMYISYIYLADDEMRLSSTYGIDKNDFEDSLKSCFTEMTGKSNFSMVDILSMDSKKFEELRQSALDFIEGCIKTCINEEEDAEFISFTQRLDDIKLEELPKKEYHVAVFDFFFGDKDSEMFVSVFQK